MVRFIFGVARRNERSRRGTWTSRQGGTIDKPPVLSTPLVLLFHTFRKDGLHLEQQMKLYGRPTFEDEERGEEKDLASSRLIGKGRLSSKERRGGIRRGDGGRVRSHSSLLHPGERSGSRPSPRAGNIKPQNPSSTKCSAARWLFPPPAPEQPTRLGSYTIPVPARLFSTTEDRIRPCVFRPLPSSEQSCAPRNEEGCSRPTDARGDDEREIVEEEEER